MTPVCSMKNCQRLLPELPKRGGGKNPLAIGINNDVIGVKTSSDWYSLTRIRVAALQICQDILYHDYTST